MSEDSHNSENHSGKVTVGISYEDFGGVPIVTPQCERNPDKWEKHVKGEQMGIGCWMRIGVEEVVAIVQCQQDCNHK